MNPASVVQDLIGRDAEQTLFRAILLGITNGQGTIRRDGSDVTEGPYPSIDSVVFTVGDEVLIARVGTGYVIVGRIRRDGLPAAVPPLVTPMLSYAIDSSDGNTIMTTAGTIYDTVTNTVSLAAGTWLVFAFFGLFDANAATLFTPRIRDSANNVLKAFPQTVAGGPADLFQQTILVLTAAKVIKPSASSSANGSNFNNSVIGAVRVG